MKSTRCLLFWLLVVGTPVATFSAAVPTKPNIIFILADDLSWGDLGCYGQRLIKTPNLDRMAREGMRFTNAYAGSAVCAPSRSCLMQGLHTGHARVRGNSYQSYREGLAEQDVTIAELLRDHGYATGLFGKWGLGLSSQPASIPNAQGFDEFFGYLNRRKAHSYYPPFLWEQSRKVLYPAHLGHKHQQQSLYDAMGRVRPAGIAEPALARYSFDEIHQRSLQFIRDHQHESFFLYLAPTLPHGPLIVPELGEYHQREWAVGHKEWAAMVSRLDTAVGEVLQLIEELQLDERTLILFASDNGHSTQGYERDKQAMPIGQHFQSFAPTRGKKGGSYDGSFRVPALARWRKQIPAGQVCRHIWAFWDFLPTAAEIAGIPNDQLPRHDGISIWPALRGRDEEQQQHAYLYWEFGGDQAVRAGDWYARRQAGGKPELYDLINDSQQVHDLAERYPERTDQMMQWMDSSHQPSDVWPSPGESAAAFRSRLKKLGVPPRPKNIDG